MVTQPSRLCIFDNRLEFINASRTNDTTRKAVEYGATRQPNPRLHRIFTRPEYGCESQLRGIPALRRVHYAFTRQEARLSVLNDEFRLEIQGI